MKSRKSYLLIWFILYVLLFSGCGNEAAPQTTKKTTQKTIESDSSTGNPIQLVWLTDSTWVDDVSESRKEAINQRIHELGYNYDISFAGLNADSYESYQKGISKAKKEKNGDLMWTGTGDGDHPEKSGTYISQIQKGNLLPLNSWLKTKTGKTLKKEYSKNVWKRIEYKGKVYGVYNEKEQAKSTYLLINANKVKTRPDFMNESSFDIDKLYDWICNNKDNTTPALYLSWNDLGEYDYDRFTNLGYIGVSDGLYMSEEGKFQNIWKNKDVRKFWVNMVHLNRKGLLSCDQNEDYAEAMQGNFLALIATQSSEYMDGKFLYLEDGNKIPVYSYKLSSRYLSKMENDVHGVTSWTKHPKEAKQLLTLVNTDKELANLIYFGEEGKDYTMQNDKVVGAKHTMSYCPTKLTNTKYSIDEANSSSDKAKYYYDANKDYKISPAAGFVPNIELAGGKKQTLNEIDNFYHKILESEQQPEQMIDNFVKKLEKERYPEFLGNIQKQYNRWKAKHS